MPAADRGRLRIVIVHLRRFVGRGSQIRSRGSGARVNVPILPAKEEERAKRLDTAVQLEHFERHQPVIAPFVDIRFEHSSEARLPSNRGSPSVATNRYEGIAGSRQPPAK